MDIHNLDSNIFLESNGNVLHQFLNSCADEICNYPGPSYQEFSNNMNWTEEDYNRAYALFSTLLRTPAVLYLNAEKMPQDFQYLPEHVQDKVMECLRVRREQLTTALLKEHSKKQGPTMTDFDYRLKLVMGSSKLASLREPLLELDLTIEREKDCRILGLEMNREELDTFISILESINS